MATRSIPAATAPRAWLPSVVGMLVVVAVALGASLVLMDAGRRSAIEDLVTSPGGLIVLFVASVLSSATLVLPVPGMALTVLAATVADPLSVGVFAGAGQAIGELTGYAAGATGTAAAAERIRQSRMAAWMHRHGVATIFVLAVVPNPVFDVAGVLAGAMRMPLVQYLAAAGAGKVLRNTIVAYAAAQGSVLLIGTPS